MLFRPADVAYSYVGAWVEGTRSGPGTETLSDNTIFKRAFHIYVREGGEGG